MTIHEKVERWIQIAQAILLSAVVVMTGWCGYQASKWGGIQTFKLAESNASLIAAAKKTMIAESKRTVDAMLTVSFVNAVIQRNEALTAYYIKHLGPEFSQLFRDWLATKPGENPTAPAHPLVMKQYTEIISPSYDRKTDDLIKAEKLQLNQAYDAKHISDYYTYKTVLLSAVLFIGGILQITESQKLKLSLLGIAYFVAVIISAQIFALAVPKIL
jgi:hypothetical protein